MTGPEHYREAERLMAPKPGTEARTFLPTPLEISLAQVHATLALAAATAPRPPGYTAADAWRVAIYGGESS